MRVRILLLALLLLVAGAQALAQRPASGSVELITTLSGHKQNVIAIEFSHDGARLATSSEDGTVRLWSVANGECLATIPGDEKSEPWKISWSPDDRKLAITLRRWKIVECSGMGYTCYSAANHSASFPKHSFAQIQSLGRYDRRTAATQVDHGCKQCHFL